MRFLALFFAASLTGCAALTAQVAVDGPVTVIIADDVPASCVRITGKRHAWGCTITWPNGYVSILCPPYALAQCLAHEVRHAVDPKWSHE